MEGILLFYIIAINIVAFIVYANDKMRAERGRWRTPEAALLIIAAVGGAAGAWIAMHVFRHKTRKVKFRYGVPALFVLHVIILIAINS